MEVRIKNHESVDDAISILKKIQEINDFGFMDELVIVLDYELDDAGYYPYTAEEKREFGGHYNEIYVNPGNCTVSEKQFGYTDDYCLRSTIIHEFCHYLDKKRKIFKQYETHFPEDSLYLNTDSKEDILEEICEIMVLYVNNPYLLKHINAERYYFMTKIFESPTECSARKFIAMWKKWTLSVRKKCRKKWGIWMRTGEIHT